MVKAVGISTVHFGIVVTVNLAIGLFHPPFGINIFVAQSVLGLKLETTIKPLPVDSTVLIRPRSALGLKYVEITKGMAVGADAYVTKSFSTRACSRSASSFQTPHAARSR